MKTTIRPALLTAIVILHVQAMQSLAAAPAKAAAGDEDADGRQAAGWFDRLLDELDRKTDTPAARHPFSFVCGGRRSDDLLPGWTRQTQTAKSDADRAVRITTWTDARSGLRVEWHVTRFHDFPAADWVLYFENTGTQDTPIVADVQAMDLAWDEPLAGAACYRLHRTNGAPSNPSDFEPALVELGPESRVHLGGGGGRSSNKDFPFVKIESAAASYIVAVGWSGQWAMDVACRGDRRLHATAGLERTHFKLHPGERVRTPRILVFRRAGDTLEANARFRELIYRHYAARRDGKPPLPTLFCNTCFTRGGGWLNECNAANQISLIRADAPLGLEALITDAGWFEGGWPAGAGNWNPRKDAYPQGMAPVAAAAKQHGMAYGLWFEFERVVAGTPLAQDRPQWLLKSVPGAQDTYLLNLGLPEARQHLFGIVKGFMDLPGFRFYRSDFNIDPLPYWRYSDAPDRQGITEMKYVAGLYDFWDRLAEAWPDALREECASGGRRIDLETIMRMHFHQESDYWFDNEVDLAVVWSLSRYLPNSTFTTPLVRLDDRSFHSTMATSLIPGWIADEKGFDAARAKELTDTYRRLRRLLVGRYYPLTPYARDGKHWMALQFHRADLGEGLVLVVPPRNSAERSLVVQLHGLEPEANYEIHAEIQGQRQRKTGAELMKGLVVSLPAGDGGDHIVYRKTP
ncbi:MAG: alpha-galactosidase [Pirellulales bacterium]